MTVLNSRTGKRVRLSRAQKLFASDREITDEAYPGDIIGLTNPGAFAIGDTVTTGIVLSYEGIPQFSPEQFATIRPSVPAKRKQLLKGLDQLREGAIQVMWQRSMRRPDPILAAVGALQFDVVRFRLEAEYNVETILQPLPFSVARWIEGAPEDLASIELVRAGARGRGRRRTARNPLRERVERESRGRAPREDHVSRRGAGVDESTGLRRATVAPHPPRSAGASP